MKKTWGSWGAGVKKVALKGTENDDELKVVDSTQVTVYGGSGNDRIYMQGSCEDSIVLGGAGNDYIRFVTWNGWNNTMRASVLGGSGNDSISFEEGFGPQNLGIEGNDGNDMIWGTKGQETIFGGTGNDSMAGYGGNDSLFGNDGNDFIWAGDGNDSVWGGNGRDKIYGQGGADVLVGEAGNDTLYGGDGNDMLTGDAADLPVSLHGADVLVGGNGNDTAWGGAGNDTLVGGTGADWLYGGTGNDTIYGSGSGADGSRDVYVYYKGDGVDKVMDFESGVDVVYLPNARFTRAKMVGRDLYAFVGNNKGIIISNAAGKTIQYCDASTNNRIRAIRL